MPNYFGHADNYIMANPMVTPAHIVPEWYLLPMYAILRSIPNKLGGAIAMAAAIIIIVILPFFIRVDNRSALFRPIYKGIFWLFVIDCMILGWIGGNAIKYPYYSIGQYATVFYFLYFLILIPIGVEIEFFMWRRDRIMLFKLKVFMIIIKCMLGKYYIQRDPVWSFFYIIEPVENLWFELVEGWKRNYFVFKYPIKKVKFYHFVSLRMKWEQLGEELNKERKEKKSE